MCGHDWCSVRISKEITEWASGKDADVAWEKAKITEALSADQREILEKRGVLSPEEIHRLASKTKKTMKKQEADKASCHSDYVDPDEAKRLQEKLVQVDVRPALGLSKQDSVL